MKEKQHYYKNPDYDWRKDEGHYYLHTDCGGGVTWYKSTDVDFWRCEKCHEVFTK